MMRYEIKPITSAYDDLWTLDNKEKPVSSDWEKRKRNSHHNQKRIILLFIEQYSRDLDRMATGYFNDDA